MSNFANILHVGVCAHLALSSVLIGFFSLFVYEHPAPLVDNVLTSGHSHTMTHYECQRTRRSITVVVWLACGAVAQRLLEGEGSVSLSYVNHLCIFRSNFSNSKMKTKDKCQLAKTIWFRIYRTYFLLLLNNFPF